MGKEREGDTEQRRAAAREARERGTTPSEAGVTTGASKQRQHLGGEASHAEKMAGPGRGKQQPGRSANDPRPGSAPTPEPRGENVSRPRARTDIEPGELSAVEERVFETIASKELEEGAVSMATIARECDIDLEAAEQAVVDLVEVHDVVVELEDDRYAVKARAT